MQIGFLPKQQAELLNAILGYLASSYAILCLPPSKYFQTPLRGLVSRVFQEWKGQTFLQSTTSQTWKDRGALLSLCCQITPSCRLVKFPFQSIVSTQPGATAPSVVPGCNPQPPSIEPGYTRAGISTRPRSKGRVLTRSSWFERFYRDEMVETSNDMYPMKCIGVTPYIPCYYWTML